MNGRPLTGAALRYQRTLENYLAAGLRPRWMERLMEIEIATRRIGGDLARARRALRERHGGDAEAFARAWRARVHAWDFEPANRLIREHNEWFPIERDLPMNPRTGEYLPIAGRSYRREELTPAWALERFSERQ